MIEDMGFFMIPNFNYFKQQSWELFCFIFYFKKAIRPINNKSVINKSDMNINKKKMEVHDCSNDIEMSQFYSPPPPFLF